MRRHEDNQHGDGAEGADEDHVFRSNQLLALMRQHIEKARGALVENRTKRVKAERSEEQIAQKEG